MVASAEDGGAAEPSAPAATDAPNEVDDKVVRARKDLFDSDSDDDDDVVAGGGGDGEAGPSTAMDVDEDAPASAPGGGGGDADGEGEEDAKAKEAQKKAQFNAIFGDSDSDDDSDDDAPIAAPIPPVAKRKRKGPTAASKGAGRKRIKGKGRLKKKAAAAPSTADADETAMWDAVDSENDDEGVATAADKRFIDDEGAERYGSSDDEGDGVIDAPEAEEDDGDMDEIDAKLKARTKRSSFKKMSPGDKQNIARTIISRMEAALDKDKEAIENRQPAINKLKLLPQIEKPLLVKPMHEIYLDEGMLNMFKEWLWPGPYPHIDGSLPSLKIRSTILRVLQAMNIDPNEYVDQLKSSEIAKVTMFYARVTDETGDNRRIANELVKAWSRHIFQTDAKYTEANRKGRGGGKEKVRGIEGAPGSDVGVIPAIGPARQRVSIPQPSRMDFSFAPESNVDMDRAKEAFESKKARSEMGKGLLLKKLGKK